MAGRCNRRIVARLTHYLKERLDRRYAIARDLEKLRKELDDLKAGADRKSPRPAALGPTAPGDHSIRLEVFRSVLASMQPGRLLDLATGHGLFATDRP